MRGLRVTASQGHAIIGGSKTTHYLPAPSPEALCPHKPGDLLALTFPQLALDSYGQTILNRHGEPRMVYGHEARLRVLEVASEDAGVEGSAVWVLTFKLHYLDRDLYLAKGAGYTTVFALAVDELPVVDADLLNPKWVRSARERWAKDRNGRVLPVGRKPPHRRAA